jgi:hypothetical protein
MPEQYFTSCCRLGVERSAAAQWQRRGSQEQGDWSEFVVVTDNLAAQPIDEGLIAASLQRVERRGPSGEQ